VNTRGRLVAERLAWSRELRFEDADLQQMLDELIAEGEGELLIIRGATHGYINIHSLNPEATGEWMSFMNLMDLSAVQRGSLTILDWLETQRAADLVAREARGA
jgi:hypothetical protein